MRHRTRRGRFDGLFTWTTQGDTAPAEITDNPRLRPCPHCHAPAGDPCRTRTGRRTPMVGYHDSRQTIHHQEQT